MIMCDVTCNKYEEIILCYYLNLHQKKKLRATKLKTFRDILIE